MYQYNWNCAFVLEARFLQHELIKKTVISANWFHADRILLGYRLQCLRGDFSEPRQRFLLL